MQATVADSAQSSDTDETSHPISAANPMLNALSEAITESGLPSAIEEYAPGDYWLVSESEETPFFVSYLDECDQIGLCNWIVFIVSFSGYSATVEQLEAWSESEPAVDAFVDDNGDIILHLSLELNQGSMNKDELGRHIGTWRDAYSRFYKQLVDWE